MASKPVEAFVSCSESDTDTTKRSSSGGLQSSSGSRRSSRKTSSSILDVLKECNSNMRREYLNTSSDDEEATCQKTSSKQNAQQKEIEKQKREARKFGVLRSTKEVNLADTLKQCVMQKKFTDLTIHIGNYSFKCHRMVLATKSQTLGEAAKGKLQFEIDTQMVTPRAFFMLYKWAVTDDMPGEKISNKALIELLQAAMALEVPQLQEDCWRVLETVCAVREDHAFELYVESSKRSITEVADMCINTITTYFLPILGTEAFLKMPIDDVERLISSKRIAVHDELQVVLGASMWLLHDWDNRAPETMKLMEGVHFAEINKVLLLSLRLGDCTSLQPIMDFPGIQEMVDEALAECLKYSSNSMFFDKEPPVKATKPSRIILVEDNYWKILKDPENKTKFFDVFLEQVKEFDNDYWASLKCAE